MFFVGFVYPVTFFHKNNSATLKKMNFSAFPGMLELLKNLLHIPNPEIILKGDVDQGMYDYVFWALAMLRSRGSPELIVTIDSPGGASRWGRDIYDLFKGYAGRKTGIGVSDTSSAASYIMQAFDVRCLTQHAGMLIHNPSAMSVSLDDLSSKRKYRDLLRMLRESREKSLTIYMTRTGRTRQQISRQLAKNESMSAREALAFGLIDKIIS